MTERKWLGVGVLVVFLVGVASGRLHAPGLRTVATTHDEAKVQQTAHVDEQRAAVAVATAEDTGTERIERTSTRAPSGAVETHTVITRGFALRSARREQEHEETHTQVQTVVQVVHDTKTVTEVRESRPDWSLAVLGGIDAGVTPLVAAQVGRRVLGPFEVVVQVQVAPSSLSRWAVFAGVGARF